MPCAAPVTSATRPSKRMCMCRSGLERRERQRAAAVLDVVDQSDQPADRGRLDARLAPELADDADLLIDLGLALAHGEIAPDAGVGLGGVAGVIGKRRDRGARALPLRRRESRRVELLEADRRDAARLGDRDDFASKLSNTDEAPRVGEILASWSRRSARSRTASRHRRAYPRDSPRYCRSAPRRARTY